MNFEILMRESEVSESLLILRARLASRGGGRIEVSCNK
jgi:hypothetical protein